MYYYFTPDLSIVSARLCDIDLVLVLKLPSFNDSCPKSSFSVPEMVVSDSHEKLAFILNLT